MIGEELSQYGSCPLTSPHDPLPSLTLYEFSTCFPDLPALGDPAAPLLPSPQADAGAIGPLAGPAWAAHCAGPTPLCLATGQDQTPTLLGMATPLGTSLVSSSLLLLSLELPCPAWQSSGGTTEPAPCPGTSIASSPPPPPAMWFGTPEPSLLRGCLVHPVCHCPTCKGS